MITSCCASEGQTDGTRDNAAVWLCDAGSHQTIGYSKDTGHKIIFIDIHWNHWVSVNNTQAYPRCIYHPQSKAYLPWFGKVYPYISTRKAHWVWQWSERRLRSVKCHETWDNECHEWGTAQVRYVTLSRSHAALGAKNNATAGTESFIRAQIRLITA